jgi:hypothetical protein
MMPNRECPFCGSYDITVTSDGDVICCCGARGPTGDSETDNIRLWNFRDAHDALVAQRDALAEALEEAAQVLTVLARGGHIPEGGECTGNILSIEQAADTAHAALALAKGEKT